MPEILSYFQGTDGKCETLSKVVKPLVLTWQDKALARHKSDADIQIKLD